MSLLLTGCDTESSTYKKIKRFELNKLDKSEYDVLWTDYDVVEVYEEDYEGGE